MNEAAFFIGISLAVLVSILIVILLPLMMLGERYQLAQVKAQARRITDAKMAARLLRFNI
jgi:hypothetical protein